MEDYAALLNTCKTGLFVMNKILVMQMKQLFALHSFMQKRKSGCMQYLVVCQIKEIFVWFFLTSCCYVQWGLLSLYCTQIVLCTRKWYCLLPVMQQKQTFLWFKNNVRDPHFSGILPLYAAHYPRRAQISSTSWWKSEIMLKSNVIYWLCKTYVYIMVSN